MKTRSPIGPSAEARCIENSRSEGHPILFGTSGWRGALGEEVTFPRLRVLARSVAEWFLEHGVDRRVLVGWDTRFASRSMAEMTSAVLVEAGLTPLLSDRATPTPALTHALTRQRFAGALILTASHNPALDHGLKVFGSGGSSIDDATARHIEAIAAGRMSDSGPARGTAPESRENFLAGYVAALDALLDRAAFERSQVSVIYDAMHGSGGGILDAVLEKAGAKVRRLRIEPDPNFGGAAPDPTPERLADLASETAQVDGLALGLATDGDGDRFGASDGRGRILSETQVLALLVDHLAATGRIQRGLALGVATGSLVEKVATAHGLPVQRHPVGFKHLSAALEAGAVDVAGEESGGFALGSMGRDKDGLLAGCLLANLVATSGEPLEVHLDRIESRFGRSACGRRAIPRTPALHRALDRLTREPPQILGGVRVEQVDHASGLRLGLEDGGFLMFRRSGTESMIRLYAEAETHPRMIERLEWGRQLLEADTKAR